MLKRIVIYLNEMYPVIPRLILSLIIFYALYFLTILVYQVEITAFGIEELLGVSTAFLFWLFLRVADDFKDRETDRRLFPERAYPSGRVKTKDLVFLLALDIVLMVGINLIFPISLGWFLLLLTYGVLMSFWFFLKKYIQNNLILALITHNPVQLFLNYYLISLVCTKYNLPIFTVEILFINLMLYMPGLEWEISRKIKAPRDENDYVTYSKILGYKKASILLLFVSLIELVISIYIAAKFAHPFFLGIMVVYYLVLCKKVHDFIKEPEAKKNRIGVFTQVYIYLVQSTIVVLSLFSLFFG